MKRLITLTSVALLALSASATDYNDQLKVTVGTTTMTQPASISVDQQADGRYTLTLRDFQLVQEGATLPVGNIVIKDAKAVEKDGVKGFSLAQDIKIEEGSAGTTWLGPSLGDVPLRLTAEFTADKLYTNISIPALSVSVEFGNRFSTAFYQPQNAGFEEFVGSGKTLEPKYWHSFPSAGGSMATGFFSSFVKGTQKVFEGDARPGSEGTKSVKIISNSVWGTIANGNLTTGRVIAGSSQAANLANHNLSNPTSTDTDQSGAPFVQPFFGRPDSLVVWIKFIPKTASSEASVRATIHDNTSFQEPNDGSFTNTVGTAATTITATSGAWKRISIPFVYTANDVVPANILFSFSTNKEPGKGDGGDELFIDDIEMIYKSPLLPTGIANVAPAAVQPSAETGIFSLDGRRVIAPQSGKIYIVKEAHRPARKVRY